MLPTNREFDGKQRVEADEKILYRSYRIEQQGRFRLTIRVISINSEYNQGIAFSFTKQPKFQGTLYLNGKIFVPEKKRQNYIIPVTCLENKEIVMDLDVQDGYFLLANASDFLDDYPNLIDKISQQTGRSRNQFRGNSYTSGFTAANLYGNAFWLEMLSENHYRFHCNDHKMDNDFDDMIFEMTITDLSL